ncbi:MAG: S16 family serine protease [Myxococcota bacterium]
MTEVLGELEAARGVGPRRHLMDVLRRVVAQADPGSVSDQVLRRLEQVGLTAAELAPLTGEVPEHAVYVPLVTVGDGDGFCRLMIASYDPSGTRMQRERYDPAARAAVADGFSAAAEALGRVQLGAYTFLPYRPGVLGQVHVSGASLGAATTVSAASVWSGRSVRAGTAVTGRIAGERVAAVGGMGAKVAALVGRRELRRLLVPSEDHAVAAALAEEHDLGLEVHGVATVGELLEAALEPEARLERNPDKAVAEAHAAYGRGWQGWQWPALRERLSRLAAQVPSRRPDLQVRVFTMLASVHRNLGDPAESLEMLEEALAVLATEEAQLAVPDEARTFLYRHLGVTLRLLCRFDEALDAAYKAEDHARRGRLRGGLAYALGTRGLVHLSRGEVDQAIACQEEALHHLLRHDPTYAVRTAANLVEALGRAGRTEQARARYDEGQALAERTVDPARRRTDEQWLRTRLAGALRSPEDAAEVQRVLMVPCVQDAIAQQPLPGLLARRWLGIAEIELGEREAGYARLAQSPAAYPKAREPHVRFLAQLNVLYEGRARAARSELDADALQRMRLALTHLPQTPAAASFLSPPARAVIAALEAPGTGDGALVRALDAFLAACRSLS